MSMTSTLTGWAMGLGSSQGMVVDDIATTLAYRSRTGKRRVHFSKLLSPDMSNWQVGTRLPES
jgi:hypothetical protein